ncbi:hypothetical protein EVAR_95528_1 [Eumeta japonica]|uniref:Uncharacterized protein n=1 Tax=Eumeta variegata TaxID=151549 RepID=A0A4C1UIV1_EUMVA|nr:hypothetical protein EVAR_95528_1 [Eumeta japonica]
MLRVQILSRRLNISKVAPIISRLSMIRVTGVSFTPYDISEPTNRTGVLSCGDISLYQSKGRIRGGVRVMTSLRWRCLAIKPSVPAPRGLDGADDRRHRCRHSIRLILFFERQDL